MTISKGKSFIFIITDDLNSFSHFSVLFKNSSRFMWISKVVSVETLISD